MPDIRTFEFSTSPRIIFGAGTSAAVGECARVLCTDPSRLHAFLITGQKALREAGVTDRITATLSAHGFAVTTYSISGEPTVSVVDDAVRAAKEANPSVVIALGGGSVLDTGKAVAGLLVNDGSVSAYIEGVGTGRTIDSPALPTIAMPTTAGTGSEVTKNAVISADDGSFKKSMRSPYLIPRVALLDPTLTHTAPPDVTAFSGLDALTQLIESYTSNGASPVTDALAEQGMRLAARSLRRAFDEGSNAAARSDMALAALLGGMCLANAGLGAAHGLVAPLGARYPVPHGAGCAALIPHVAAMNIRRLLTDEPDGLALTKYRRVGKILRPTGSDPLNDGVAVLRELTEEMRVPGLGRWGLTPDGIGRVVPDARGSSMRYNPVALTDDELAEILAAAI